MAEKKRVRIHCQVCNKITVHEVRMVDGQESCICLQCAGIQKDGENALLRYQNRSESGKYETERAIEAERTRTFSPGG
jgi:hypothetical protein